MNADMLGTTLAHCRRQAGVYDEAISDFAAAINKLRAKQMVRVFSALLERYDIRNHKVWISCGMGAMFLVIDDTPIYKRRWGEYRSDLLKGVTGAIAVVRIWEYLDNEVPYDVSQYMDGMVLVNKQGEPNGKQ